MVKFHVKRLDQDPCDTSQNGWMVNNHGVNPCRLVEQIMQTCRPEPPVVLDPVSGNLTCPLGSSSSCCCSVATYALLSACWVCEGHHARDIDGQIQPSYADFLQGCLDPNATLSFPNDIELSVQSLNIPAWALIRPAHLTDHWDFHGAKANGSTVLPPSGLQPPLPQTSTSLSLFPTPSSTGISASSAPVLNSSKSPTSPGTIAASVLGSIAFAAVLCLGGWLFWRWRRRRMIRPSKGVRVDLTEPEMQGPSSRAMDPILGNEDPLQRMRTFPFPYEGVVPRYHPNAPHSLEPAHTDEDPAAPVSEHETRPSRRHTAPSGQPQVMDQLDRDLASLKGVTVPQPAPGEGSGQVHHPYIHKTPRRRATSITTFTPSSNSGSASSRRARRKSGADGAAKGRYFHLPPSAQYLADIARYPEKVDPNRPWDIR